MNVRFDDSGVGNPCFLWVHRFQNHAAMYILASSISWYAYSSLVVKISSQIQFEV